MTLMLSFGKYGGFYCQRGRLCLGWVALTFLCVDIDIVLSEWMKLKQEGECDG